MASTKTRRGAKAPRSSFRAKSPAKKPPAKKPPAKKPPAKKPPAKKPPAPRLAGDVIGELRIPSGTLALFDVGLVGYLPREALEPAIVKVNVPADRPLPVIGVRLGSGRDAWDHVSVIVGDGEITHARKLGEAGVDFARLLLIDHAAFDHWQHEDSLDGKADLIFGGKDEQILARVMGAPRTAEGYGWTNLPVAEAESKWELAERKKAENRWRLTTELRPHTHHFHALAAARANKHGAGALELAGTKLLLIATGNGVFPIHVDLDGEDRAVQVRIQLAAAKPLKAVNRGQ